MNIGKGTHQGARAYQEDRLVVMANQHTFAVFDGLGGEKNGALASDKAACCLLTNVVYLGDSNRPWSPNWKLVDRKVKDTGGLTTVVYASIFEDKLFLMSCGDSYIFVDGELINDLDEDRWGAITSCLGGHNFRPHFYETTVDDVSRVVLASDGIGTFHHAGSDHTEVLELLFTTPNPQKAVDKAIESCLTRFPRVCDNVSIIAIDL